MATFHADGGAVFDFKPDLSGTVLILDSARKNNLIIDGADLIEFMRHVDGLKRKGHIVYNGDNEFEISGHRSTMRAGGLPVTGDASCKVKRGDTFNPSLPTTIGEMPIRITRPDTVIGPAPHDMLVGFDYVSAWEHR